MQIELTTEQQAIYAGRICPYCKQKSNLLTDSTQIYGRNLGPLYICFGCQAWVGLHLNGKAKGRLANQELRRWKIRAHGYFDMIWNKKIFSRAESYRMLSEYLNIPKSYTHIGMFSIKTCREVIVFSKQLMNDQRRLDLDFGAIPATPYFESE